MIPAFADVAVRSARSVAPSLRWARARRRPSPPAQTGSPAGPVPVERLVARRQRCWTRLGTGVAVVPAGKLRSIEGDYPQDSDYREANDFFYLTGIEAPVPGWCWWRGPSGADSAILYLPGIRVGPRHSWTGRVARPRGRRRARLTGHRATVRAGFRRIPARSWSTGTGRPRASIAGAPASTAELASPPADQGCRRDPPAAPSGRDHDRGLRWTRWRRPSPGCTSTRWRPRIEYGFRRRGAERVGFPSIVGSGPNSTILHYDENRRRMEAGDLVVIDIGAEYGYYTADITRTHARVGTVHAPPARGCTTWCWGPSRPRSTRSARATSLGTLDQIARTYLRTHSGDLCGGSAATGTSSTGCRHWLGMDVHDRRARTPGGWSPGWS